MADIDPTKWFSSKWAKIGIAAVTLLGVGTLTAKQMFTTNDAGYYMVIQNPITGNLSWELSPGLKWRMFGKVTVYPQRETFWFSTRDGQPASPAQGQSIRLRFNDGGHANLSGSISWEMPVDIDHLNMIHNKFRSPEAIDQSLIRTVIEKSVYTAGPMMSSTESYASRRNELLHIVEDQITNGVYETETIRTTVKDPVTNEVKTVDTVRIKMENGQAVHAVDSPLKEFGVKTFNLAMNEIKYDPEIEDQIKAQQKAIANIQISTAQAKQAQQDAITAEAQGQAKAATAKWEKEVLRTAATVSAQQEKDVAVLNAARDKEVAETNANRDRTVALTAANRDREVADLRKQTADAEKAAAILRGEGEARARELVMTADGALKQKLDAWLEAQKAYATAIGNYKGAWVPSVVMGSNAANGGSNATAAGGAQQLIDLLTAKTARDLGLNLDVQATPAK